MTVWDSTRPQVGLWASVWKLLKLRLIILISGFRRATTRRKISMVVIALLILGILVFIFYLSWMLLKFLQSPELNELVGEMLPLLESVPALIFTGAFIGILVTSFGVLLQALYLSGDMEFLLSVPLPIRAVFVSKLLQAVLPNFALICLFALPVLYGLGFSNGYQFIYYPFVLLVLVALALAASGISSLGVMLVVRIFPARRVAEVLGFLGAILSFLCSQSGQLANLSDVSSDQAAQALAMVHLLDASWSPLAWTGRGLVSVGQGEWVQGISIMFFTLVAGGLVFALALTTSERLYFSGWARVKSKAHKVKSPRRVSSQTTAPLALLLGRFLPSQVRAIMIKDWHVLQRDLRNMSQLVTPLIIGIIYAVMFLRSDGPPMPEDDLPVWVADLIKNTFVYFNVGLSLFVGWMLLGRLAGTSFSQEGRSYWVLKSAPVEVSKLIAAKFLVAYLPVLALSWIFLMIISLVQHVALSTLLFTLPVIALCIFGNAGINLTFGITGANFAWDDPRKMQKGGSGCLAALVAVIYLPVSLALFFGPPILAPILNLPEIAGQITGFLLGGLFSLACAIVPLRLVSARVPTLGEPV